MVVILAVVLAAFNLKSYDMQELEISQRTAENVIDETIIQTFEEEVPPPPEPEAPEVTTELVVVENDAEIEHEVGIIDMGDDANKAQEAFTPVVQEVEEEAEEEEIFVFIEEQASFPGGTEALYKFLRENIKYPPAARENGIEGKVFLKFVVEKDGSVSNVKVMRDIGSGCGAEAVRVVKSMPKWTPGKQRGRAVRSEYSLPVSFSLR